VRRTCKDLLIGALAVRYLDEKVLGESEPGSFLFGDWGEDLLYMVAYEFYRLV
jgi:hypothetical protein